MCAINLSEASVLVVDDEVMLLEIFSGWLRDCGVGKFYTAANGEAALAVLGEHPVDILISDLIMPVMDGITLVRNLTGVAGKIPSIVFVSGFSDIDAREMYDLGVEALVPKPISREVLIDVLNRALADRATLWLRPMDVAPKQFLSIKEFRPEDKAGCLRLGKGGFRSRYDSPLRLGKVDFDCSLPGNRELKGQGYVRWLSKIDKVVGIEFAYLDACCRSWVTQEIAEARPRSFIPSL